MLTCKSEKTKLDTCCNIVSLYVSLSLERLSNISMWKYGNWTIVVIIVNTTLWKYICSSPTSDPKITTGGSYGLVITKPRFLQ